MYQQKDKNLRPEVRIIFRQRKLSQTYERTKTTQYLLIHKETPISIRFRYFPLYKPHTYSIYITTFVFDFLLLMVLFIYI